MVSTLDLGEIFTMDMQPRVGAYFHPGKIEKLTTLAKADIATTILMNLRSIRPVLTHYKADHSVPVTIHAPYSINIGHRDKFIRDASFGLLVKNAKMSADIGALGVTFHGGSIRNNPDWLESFKKLSDFDWPCRIMIENGSNLKGSCSAATDELYTMFDVLIANPNIGMTLDTAHVWAMFDIERGRETYVKEIMRACSDRIWLVHANGSAAWAGKQHDIHAPFAESKMKIEEVAHLAEMTGCADWVIETKEPVDDIARMKSEINRRAYAGR